MQLSDFFIGKPGPGSISEAIAAAAARHRRAQRLDHAAGALQRASGCKSTAPASCWIRSTPIRAGRIRSDEPRCDEYRASVAASESRDIRDTGHPRANSAPQRFTRRIGVDFIQHFRAAQRLHLTQVSIRAAAERTGRCRRRVALRIRQYGGEDGGIAAREPRCGLVEESLRGGFGAVGAVAELGDVEIDLQDAPLRPAGSRSSTREIGLEPLAKIAAAGPEEEVLGDLLADGAGAAHLVAVLIRAHRPFRWPRRRSPSAREISDPPRRRRRAAGWARCAIQIDPACGGIRSSNRGSTQAATCASRHECAEGRIDPAQQQHRERRSPQCKSRPATTALPAAAGPRMICCAPRRRQAGIRRTLFMMTASTGTSSKPRRRPVSTAAILSITSMPSVTRANTA